MIVSLHHAKMVVIALMALMDSLVSANLRLREELVMLKWILAVQTHVTMMLHALRHQTTETSFALVH